MGVKKKTRLEAVPAIVPLLLPNHIENCKRTGSYDYGYRPLLSAGSAIREQRLGKVESPEEGSGHLGCLAVRLALWATARGVYGASSNLGPQEDGSG